MTEPLIITFAAALVASAAFMVATVVLMGDTSFKRSADPLSATLTVALISAVFASPIFTPVTYQVPDVIHAWVNFGLATLALLLMMVTVWNMFRRYPDVPLTIHWSAWAINGILGYALCGFIPTIHFIHSVSPWA
jgi:hypothetical protein